MIAPASLKLFGVALVRPDLGTPTPGHDCPGLIEAAAMRFIHAPTRDHSGA